MADVSADPTGPAAEAKRGAALVSRGSHGFKALSSWRSLLVAGVFGFGLLQVLTYAMPTKHETRLAAECIAWDGQASEGIAALIFDNSPSAEIRLDEAIQQLRRARKYCRTGRVAVASHDYASLRRFSIATGSVKRSADRDGNAGRSNDQDRIRSS